MRRFGYILFFVSVATVVIYAWLQTPSGRNFFYGPERPEDPLAFLKEKPEEPKKPTRKTSPRAPERPRQVPAPSKKTEPAQVAAPKEEAATAPVEPAIPNQDLSRVLFGILRARNLAGGISLGIGDETVSAIGEVESADVRRQIIEILEKGRGARRLDVTELKVK